jgi:TetR/AcrR family transcriptional regulator
VTAKISADGCGRESTTAPASDAGAATRARLIDAGMQAFTSVGYNGASVRAIERDAGIGRGLVAHHFGSKDGLWRACVEWLMSEYHAEFVKLRPKLDGVSNRERARVLVTVHIRFCAHHPEYLRLLVVSGTDRSERMRWFIDEHLRPSLDFFGRLTAVRMPDGRPGAFEHYSFVGAVSLFFAVPAQSEMLFGVDTRAPDVIDQFIATMLRWLGLLDDQPDGTRPAVTALHGAVEAEIVRESRPDQGRGGREEAPAVDLPA